ncbi:galactokinase [Exiguobacterium sp. SH31]|uniref:galactokinase n=1 Tax=unclassified Exiguobacterium TaxID=2644629 RepID=UPI0008B8F5B0|nr:MULTISPECIES: galactokinase [unclassified Exiguobacterium]OGX79650.1 galactokinase [Exiguobacterium sp. SH31]TCI71248.1 galactokinase [Exiguobacterium sp. SH0S7]
MMHTEFRKRFLEGATHQFFAPGRINLIGEHVDYNGGHVFPAAITFGTYMLVRKRDDRMCRFYSINFESQGVIETSIDRLTYREEDGWANYPKAMLHYLMSHGVITEGVDCLYYGNIPNGAGLSSSASIELVSGYAFNELYAFGLSPLELVKLGQRAENEYIGVNSGIMDQFAIGMGMKDHAMLLDCETLECEYAPFKLDGLSIVIMNTNKRRELADSKYNERRNECERALLNLQRELEITALCELDVETFEDHRHLLQDDTLYRRARHAVTENARTLEALEALKGNEIERFGRLMNDSHRSLDKDYEVTGKELNTLVEAAWENHAIGARMTGAGFGGCAISLVKQESVDRFIEKVQSTYLKTIGYEATFYVASIGPGVHEIIEQVKGETG